MELIFSYAIYIIKCRCMETQGVQVRVRVVCVRIQKEANDDEQM